MKKCDCSYETEDVGRYLLNKMTLEEETTYQEHILSCPICQKKIKDIQTLCKALKNDDDNCVKTNHLE